MSTEAYLAKLGELIVCPGCRGDVEVIGRTIVCSKCRCKYNCVGNVPCLLPNPETDRAHWQQMLAKVHADGCHTVSVFERELRLPALLPLTQQRLKKQIDLTRNFLNEIDELLVPHIGHATHINPKLKNSTFLDGMHYLFRDWGWDESEENARALSCLKNVCPHSLGKVLVIGSGASRLAYDIRCENLATLVVAMDVNPLLMLTAEKILSGDTVVLTETRSNATELDKLSVERKLNAPAGKVEGVIPLLANGFAPPFKESSFDTILTPWFTDLTNDLRSFLGVVSNLLKTDGQWLHYGPLLYPNETPPAQRLSREEIYQLAEVAGFKIEKTEFHTGPYAYSPLAERGKLETAFAFSAKKKKDFKPSEQLLPSWVVLPWIPIPDFATKNDFQHESQAFTTIMRRINGDRSINDIAHQLKSFIDSPYDALVDSIRLCLQQCHPNYSTDKNLITNQR